MEESKVNDVKQKVEKKKGVGADVNERLDRIEGILTKLLQRIDLNDKYVTIPEKRNYNPDFLPTGGGPPVTLDDIENQRKG